MSYNHFLANPSKIAPNYNTTQTIKEKKYRMYFDIINVNCISSKVALYANIRELINYVKIVQLYRKH